MESVAVVLVIILAGIIGIVLFNYIKPYFIKYDTTILFTGGLGSGKSLNSVKTAIVLIRKQYIFKYVFYNKIILPFKNYVIRPIKNIFIKLKNKRRKKQNLDPLKLIQKEQKRKQPELYSNIPIKYRKFWFKKREWSKQITPEHLTLIKDIKEYSVVLLDEFPQFVNQFNWDEELVKKNLNEFITFFRHYIAGYLILNAQATSDIVVQIRRKLNQAIWCYNFKKWFWIIYTVKMCDIMLSEDVSTMSTAFIEDNTKTHFGLLLGMRKTYNSRCYSVRYNNIYIKDMGKLKEWDKLKTEKVLRMQEYTSPLDSGTTPQQKQSMADKVAKLQESQERKQKK